MAGVDKKRLDEQIARAKARREKAVAKQAKRILDVMIKVTGDEYVDADLLAEFLALPITDILDMFIKSYNGHAKKVNAKIPIEKKEERMPVISERLRRDFESYANGCNPIHGNSVKRSPDQGPCSVGEMMVRRWPEIKKQLEESANEKRAQANERRRATNEAKRKGVKP